MSLNATVATDALLEELKDRFTAWDYVVFGLMLALSASIGIYFGCIKKVKDTQEFLMASNSMTTFPVAMSLIASFMSAITLLGTPSEVYSNGFAYWLIGLAYFIVMPLVQYFYLPVFWDLKVTSAYEYLELRFSRSVRMMGSGIFIIQMTLYMSIVVYAPALALSQVTGVNVYLSVSLICFVCMFYTTLGGMKAVLWTDALQVVIMYAVMIFIIIKGTVDEGGFVEVWNKASKGNRTTLIDWSIHPTSRHTFWTLIIGGTFTWMTVYAINQAQVQRYLTVQKQVMAVRALWINAVALFILMVTCAFGGLVIFAKYGHCDPLTSGLVNKTDQLLPLYVMDSVGNLKGMPGLFVAGIFSGALSTVSSGMNSLAAITLEDFIKGVLIHDMSETTSKYTSQGLSFGYGILTFILVFVAEQLGDILSAALSIFGMVGGPLLGLFSLGMFIPWSNTKGAIAGTIFGLLFTFWIGVGFQVYKALDIIVPDKLPVYIDGCDALNFTVVATVAPTMATEVEESALMILYRTSYLWYSCIGFFSVMVVGTIVSFMTTPQDIQLVNPKLMSPLVHMIAKKIPNGELIGINYDKADEMTLRENKSLASFGNLNVAYNKEANGVQSEILSFPSREKF